MQPDDQIYAFKGSLATFGIWKRGREPRDRSCETGSQFDNCCSGPDELMMACPSRESRTEVEAEMKSFSEAAFFLYVLDIEKA